MTPAGATVVIGVGNVVRRDDGLGVHALLRLHASGAVDERAVELVEGATAGLSLLPHLAAARRAIFIDAIDAGAAPGTLVRLLGGDLPGGFRGGRTAHGVGLADLLGAARLTGAWPDQLVVHGAQPQSTEIGTELTAPVAACLDALVARVAAELRAWAA